VPVLLMRRECVGRLRSLATAVPEPRVGERMTCLGWAKGTTLVCDQQHAIGYLSSPVGENSGCSLDPSNDSRQIHPRDYGPGRPR